MPPSLITPLFNSIRTLSGVTPKVYGLLAKVLNINPIQRDPTLIDLLQLMPHSVIDRRMRPSIACTQEGSTTTLEIVIDQHQPPPVGHNRLPYRVIAHDPTGKINLVFFVPKILGSKNNYLKEKKLLYQEKLNCLMVNFQWYIPIISYQANNQIKFPSLNPFTPLPPDYQEKH